MTANPKSNLRRVLPLIQEGMNLTRSRVFLPHRWTPRDVWIAAERKGPVVVALDAERRERALTRAGYGPTNRRFTFGRGDVVLLQAKGDSRVVGRKAARGDTFGREKWTISARYATRPRTYRVTDSSGR